MFESLMHIPGEFWVVLAQMAPYLLFGFLVAGILSVLVSPETVEKHLGGKGILSVLKAAAFGVPLPLCSCGVIPVAAGLRRHGASRGATTAFLITTPETGVDSILVTWSLLGPLFAVVRPVVALVGGVLGGILVTLGVKDDGSEGAPVRCTDECCNPGGGRGGKLARALRYGFLTLPRDIGKALLIGLVVAALITVIIPKDFFALHVQNHVLQVLMMMAVGIPVYVCASASVPVAAALVLAGVSPGAALAFLITGPATNAASLSMIWKVMGRRTAILYLIAIAVTAFGSGVLLDAICGSTGIDPRAWVRAVVHVHSTSSWEFWVGNLSGIALVGVLGVAIFRPSLGRLGEPAQGAICEEHGHAHESIILTVEGMTCDHCAEAVREALAAQQGVESAAVDLKAGRAVVQGEELDLEALVRAVEDAGYKARLGSS